MDAVQRGLAAVNEFVPEFMADHAGRLEIFTYGPEGDEARVASYDAGVHEIDGADDGEWVTEGASVVISLKRRRRAEPAVAVPGGAGHVSAPVGVSAQLLPDADTASPVVDEEAAPSGDRRFTSANGVVPHMQPAAPMP